MLIRSADIADCNIIAELHRETIPGSFLGSLGTYFLATFYRAIINYRDGFIFVCETDGAICGFVSGVINIKRFRSFFIRNNLLKIIILFLWEVFNPVVIRRAYRRLRYSGESNILLPNSELVSISVRSIYRNEGIGTKLFNCLVSEFRKRGINSFKFRVGKELSKAHSFYKQLRCVKVDVLKFANTVDSDVYVYCGK